MTKKSAVSERFSRVSISDSFLVRVGCKTTLHSNELALQKEHVLEIVREISANFLTLLKTDTTLTFGIIVNGVARRPC